MTQLTTDPKIAEKETHEVARVLGRLADQLNVHRSLSVDIVSPAGFSDRQIMDRPVTDFAPAAGVVHSEPAAGIVHNEPAAGIVHNEPAAGIVHNEPAAKKLDASASHSRRSTDKEKISSQDNIGVSNEDVSACVNPGVSKEDVSACVAPSERKEQSDTHELTAHESKETSVVKITEILTQPDNVRRRKHRRPDGSGIAEIVTQDGTRTLTEWDGLGGTSLVKFDPCGRMIEQSKQTQKGFLQESKWNAAGDRRTSTFDNHGRKIIEEIAYVNGSGVLQRYEPGGSTIEKIYDGLGNSSTTTYDKLGRALINEYCYSDGARTLERCAENGSGRSFEISASGDLRSIRLINPDGTTKVWDHTQCKSKSESGHKTKCESKHESEFEPEPSVTCESKSESKREAEQEAVCQTTTEATSRPQPMAVCDSQQEIERPVRRRTSFDRTLRLLRN